MGLRLILIRCLSDSNHGDLRFIKIVLFTHYSRVGEQCTSIQYHFRNDAVKTLISHLIELAHEQGPKVGLCRQGRAIIRNLQPFSFVIQNAVGMKYPLIGLVFFQTLMNIFSIIFFVAD